MSMFRPDASSVKNMKMLTVCGLSFPDIKPSMSSSSIMIVTSPFAGKDKSGQGH